MNGLMHPMDNSMYTGYSPYNNWATKVASPLSTAKGFPWELNTMNHLSSVVSSPSASCFTSPPAPMTSSMVPPSVGVPPPPTAPSNGNMRTSSVPAAPCPYSPTTPPSYLSYNRDQCSSSIASLRLKAKEHSATNFGYPSVSPPRSQPSLSACQYDPNGTAIA